MNQGLSQLHSSFSFLNYFFDFYPMKIIFEILLNGCKVLDEIVLSLLLSFLNLISSARTGYALVVDQLSVQKAFCDKICFEKILL